MDFSVRDWLKPPKKPLVGLDLSSTAIKLLELEEASEGYQVKSFGIEFLPPGAMVNHDIKDPVAIGEAIQRVLVRAQTKAKDAAIAVSGSAVITKVIQLSRQLSEEELETQISVEIDRYIPYPLDEIRWDFYVLGPSESDPEMVKVLLAACRAENIDAHVDSLEIGGLNTRVVDLEVYAMQRTLSLLQPQLSLDEHENRLALIDIGSQSSTLIVMEDGHIIYSRDQEFGALKLIEDCMAHYDMSFNEAIMAKWHNDLPDTFEEMIQKPFRQWLIGQIGRALRFFFSSSQFDSVDRIIISGGGATITSLSEDLMGSLGIPTCTANPFHSMALSSHVNMNAITREAPAMMLSCGLAMRAFD